MVLSKKSKIKNKHPHLNIIRTKGKNKFIYTNKKGKPINDNKTIDRIVSLRIPPGYENVKISSKPQQSIQAIGIDTKGRQQYIYNQKKISERHDNKFKELITFGNCYPKIRKDIQTKLNDDDNIHSKSKILGIVLAILDRCLFRVGNQFYTKTYKTYGTITLKPQHFKTVKGKIIISFIGKKNVVNTCIIDDKILMKLLNKLLKNTEPNSFVFRYLDQNNNLHHLTANDVNDAIKTYSPNLTVKMFRTWRANYIFIHKTLDAIKKDNTLLKTIPKKDNIHHINECLKEISTILHNTPNVSKNSYMSSYILKAYQYRPIKFMNTIWDLSSGGKKVSQKDIGHILVEVLNIKL